MAEELIGKVTHYFNNIKVAVVKLNKAIKVGDRIRIKGATTDISQTVDSMQIEHKSIKEAKKGDDIGLKTKDVVRAGDAVFKVA